MDIPEEMLTAVKCCQCNNALSATPIHMYNNGEYVCGRCPVHTLLGHSGARRCTAYEELADLFVFPCLYKEQGCKAKCKPKDMLQHELYCPFKHRNCPHHTECKWSDKFKNLYDHYYKEHIGSILQIGEERELNLEFTCFDKNYILRSDSYDFLVQLRKINDDLYFQMSSINFESERVFRFYIDINFSATMDNLHVTTPEAKIQLYQLKLPIKNAYRVNLEPLFSKVPNIHFSIHKSKSAAIPVLKSCCNCECTMTPPMYQCCNGHLICCFCIEQFEICASCCVPLQKFRIRVLEEYMDNVEVDCRFCCNKYLGSKMSDHINECSSRPRKCPFDDCLKYDILLNHIRSEHKNKLYNYNSNLYKTLQSKSRISIGRLIKSEVWQKENFLFFFQFHESNENIYVTCKLLQTTEKRFHCSFALHANYERYRMTKVVDGTALCAFPQLYKQSIKHYRFNGSYKYSIEIEEVGVNDNNCDITDNYSEGVVQASCPEYEYDEDAYPNTY